MHLYNQTQPEYYCPAEYYYRSHSCFRATIIDSHGSSIENSFFLLSSTRRERERGTLSLLGRVERLSEHGDYHLFDNGMAKMIRIRVEMKSQRGESVRMRGCWILSKGVTIDYWYCSLRAGRDYRLFDNGQGKL